jgi:hypothetical protein
MAEPYGYKGGKVVLGGFGRGVSAANRPALTHERTQVNDFGEPSIAASENPFPRSELAKIGACGRGQKAKTSSER